jgi:lysylphosphatidylglycerol synthetase-like protein (DUF2156 family)/UDP-2,3-diacylglucosamine pyrophosphatase LpxH
MTGVETGDVAADPLVPDLVTVEVAPGTRMLVTSDLHLAWRPTDSSLAIAAELAAVLDGWVGPGVLVFNGDVFELLLDTQRNPCRIIDAHPRLAASLERFVAGDGRRIIVLAGNHDGALAWDERAVNGLRGRFHAELGLAAELRVETGAGVRVVRVEHGNRFDSFNRFIDPRNPVDTPIGHHVVCDVLPRFDVERTPWLEGIAELADPSDTPAFVASRLAYRRLAKHLWWLVTPLLMALVLAVAFFAADLARQHHRVRPLLSLSARLAILGTITIADVVLVGLLFYFVMRRSFRALSELDVGEHHRTPNDEPRAEAERIIDAGGSGFITGHTHQPELSSLRHGFYANCGSGGGHVRRRAAKLGLPPVFLRERQLSWVELEAGADLHVRLMYSRIDLSGAPILERLAVRPAPEPIVKPAVVAIHPGGADWPVQVYGDVERRRHRRVAGAILAVTGLLDLASAITPPIGERLDLVRDLVPITVPETASAIVAAAGLALLLLSRGVRRGQRHAWQIAVGLTALSAVLHIVKGLDLEEATAALVALGYLLAKRRAFTAAADRPSIGRGFATLGVGAAAAVIVGTVTALWIPDQSHLSVARAFAAVAERLVGITDIAIPARRDRFLIPTMGGVGLALALIAGWLVFRPVVQRRKTSSSDFARARDIVRRYGGDTLSYFSLREDKQHWFWKDTLVAFAVHNGVCLVSPDPIGPANERSAAWRAFRRYADENGWAVAVMGAGESWLPTYRATGMRDLYVGDEAIVDASRFSLDGGRMKGLRQAVNRIAKYGYRIEFHDPAHLDPALESKLRALMTESRRGEVERGFSMTLGRVFSPDDQGLLLAVCFGPAGEPAAFCQYVPARDIDGYSLDLMRRSEGDEHWNGLTDFVVVRTIEHLRENGQKGLGLNFAVMRSILAHESGDGFGHRIERWMLGWLSDSMQIESLWKYNAKFDPDWHPRYAVYDSAEHFLTSAFAVAKAESFWELPIIGRFLAPETPDKELERSAPR